MSAPYNTSFLFGDRYDGSAVVTTIDGIPILFVEFSAKYGRTPGKAEAANTPEVAGTTTGKAEGSGSLSLLQSDAVRLEKLWGHGFLEHKHTIVCTARKPGQPEYRNEYFGVELHDREEGYSPDGKAIVIKYSLYIQRARFNGIDPLYDMRF